MSKFDDDIMDRDREFKHGPSKSKRRNNKKGSGKRNFNRNNASANSNKDSTARSDKPSTATVNDMQGAPNHIEWYNQIPNLYNPAFSVPTMPALGYNVNKMIGNENVKCTSNTYPFNISGVMSFTFAPMIGEANSPTSPINQVAQYMWKKFRTGLTSNGWYEPTDLMMYVIAADSIYMLLMHLMRVYGVSTWYSATNRFLPERILLAMGIHPDDDLVNGNLPLLRMEINKLVMKMSTYHIPKGFEFVSRHSWLTGNVFADSEDGDRSQMYVFNPKYYWQAEMVEATETEGGPVLVPKTWQVPTTDDDNYLPIRDLISKIDDAITSMQEVLDAVRLSAEVDRVFGENVHTIAQIPEDFTVGPTYNINMLQQIKNIVVMEQAFTPGYIYNAIVDFGKPTQRSYIRHTIKGVLTTGKAAAYGGTPIIDYLNPKPTADDICYATRFMAYTRKSSDWTESSPKYDLICGSELITGAFIFPSEFTDGLTVHQTNYPIEPFTTHIINNSSQDYISKSQFEDVVLAMQFNSAPLMYQMRINWSSGQAIPADGAIKLDNVLGKFNNLSVITIDALANMHEAVLFSLFNYPNLG